MIAKTFLSGRWMQSLSALAVGVATATPTAQAIEFGMVTVQQNSTANTSAAVTLTAYANSPDFQVVAGFPTNRGDYGIQIGSDRSDDVASGIILASVANNGRDNGETTYAGIRYGEASIDADGSGWFVPMFDAATGAEYNFDFSAVYFPFAEGWVVGHARNSSNTNGGIYNQIRTGTGASAVALGGSSGNRLVAPGTTSAPQSSLGNGRSDLYLEGVNALTDGLLFVNHGKNEANIATSAPAADGSHFRIQVQDYDGGAEHDPVAFAYVPYGTAGVTMGRITSANSGSTYGAYAETSQGDFSVRHVAAGAFELRIANTSTTDGTLLLNAPGFESWNADNIITFEPLQDASGWRIETRDLPISTAATGGVAGQNIPNTQPIFEFMFLPTANPPTAPGSGSGFIANRAAAATYTVTEFNSGNGVADMTAAARSGTSGMGLNMINRGDNTLGMGGMTHAAASGSAGVLLASTAQGYRDNLFGVDGVALSTVWAVSGGEVLSTATASNAEMNIDFSAAWFPETAGFVQGRQVPTVGGVATVTVDPAAGLLMATPYVNAAVMATVGPVGGTALQVTVANGDGTLTSTTPFSYVFLPHDTPGLVSGSVTGTDGSVTAGADTAGYSLTRTGTGQYTLSITGKSPSTGMLLLNGVATGGDVDNFAVWEPAGSDFLIQTFDGDATPLLTDADFQFAYIDFEQALAKSSDLEVSVASLDLGKALVGATVTASFAATATSPQNYTVTSFSASATGDITVTTPAGTIRGDTANVAAASGSIDIQAIPSASGAFNETISLVNLTDTSDTSGLDVAATLEVYEAASLTQGELGAIASGGTVSIANAVAGGSLRAAAEVVSATVTGDTGWTVTGFSPGTTIAGGGTESGTAIFDATGRLNGTYDATFEVAFEHADLAIVGTAAGDLGGVSWSLSHQVTGVASNFGQANRRPGEPYQGLGLTRGEGRGTAAELLAGESGSNRTVQFGFRDAATAPVLSDILDLTGTSGDPIVLSMSYDESLLGGVAESSLLLGWLDEDPNSASFNQWVLATDGNIAPALAPGSPYQGSWTSWWADFQVANPGSPLSSAVGAYGVDPVGNTTWAVIDHNSSFAVVAVPEPGSIALACLGLGSLTWLLRCRPHPRA
jgi:hypothetical protein